ncbi:hypothetical protein KR009_011246, partial [Drosophila setifemur]
ESIALFLSWCVVIVLFPFSLLFCLVVVLEFHRVVIFRLGHVSRSFGPGLVLILPFVDEIVKVDIRTDVVVMDPQDMLTKDSVTITVNAVVYFCIYNPIDSIVKVHHVREATTMIALVTLRNIVASKLLHELLTSRQTLSREIRKAVADITGKWGVRVERVDMMDIKLPISLERSLASEAEAAREARAKIILAEGEAKASEALRDASNVMSENHISLQLRHLQVLSSMAAERRVNILFPIPLDFMEPYWDKESKDYKPDADEEVDLYLFTPKVYFSGPPPEGFLGPESNPFPGSETQTEMGGTLSFFDRLSRILRPSFPNHPQPSQSSSRQEKSGRAHTKSEPYSLLPDGPPTHSSFSRSPPIPPPPVPPPLPTLLNLPPIPPHPNLPPVPMHPDPPPRSPPPPPRDPEKPGDKYYF